MLTFQKLFDAQENLLVLVYSSWNLITA
jgi:hypothetical protein